MPSTSPEFEEIRSFIDAKESKECMSTTDSPLASIFGSTRRPNRKMQKFSDSRLPPTSNPSGEECGTIYETLCNHCNWGRQVSDLILDLRPVPQHKDISETIRLGGVGCLFKLRSNVHRKYADRSGVPSDFRIQESHQALEGLVPTVGHRESGGLAEKYETWPRSI